jgi:hypothetical protein
MDAMVECPAELRGKDMPTPLPPVLYGDYLLERLNKNYDYRKKAS